MVAIKVVNNGGTPLTTTFDSYFWDPLGANDDAFSLPMWGLPVPTVASTFLVEANAFVYAINANMGVGQTGDAVELASTNAPWTVTINGSIGSDTLRGLYLTGSPGTSATAVHKVNVGASGAIGGKTSGLQFDFATTVTNAGLISGDNIGIFGNANGNFTITNAVGAAIASESGVGIQFQGNGIHTLNNSGFIYGAGGTAIADLSASSSSVEKITNKTTGLIDGDVDVGDGDDLLSNAGTIKGDVKMGFGNDTVTNTGFIDFLGNISLGFGNDKFTGGNQAEEVVDEGGVDTYLLGAGNDFFQAVDLGSGFATSWAGKDTIDGGTGIDTYSATLDSGTGIFINLDTKAHGNDAATNFWYGPLDIVNANTAIGLDIGNGTDFDVVKNFEVVEAGSGDDRVFGNAAANKLYGNDGSDDLWGLTGNDLLAGNAGIDRIFGGAGRDDLWGGNEGSGGDLAADTFYFINKSDSGITWATRDIIWDFEQGADKIRLAFDSNSTVAGIDPFTGADFVGGPSLIVGTGTFTGNAGDIRFLWSGQYTVVEVDVSGDRKADFSLALYGTYSLTAGDFGL